jgi:hypothetical protein
MTRPSWTPERLSTRARLEPCPKCHALVIRALDGPVAAIDVRCDPTPLDLIGELSIRLQGRATYDLIGRTDRKELAYRDEWRIKKREWPVLPKHICPGPVSTKALIETRKPKPRKATNDVPPF